MTRTATIAKLMVPVVLAAALIALLAAHSGTAKSASTQLLVRTANNPTLHRKVLVNRKGMTLYSMSVEQRGRFICTDSFCLSLWTPLVVAKGTVPTGASHLATVKRPDGGFPFAARALALPLSPAATSQLTL